VPLDLRLLAYAAVLAWATVMLAATLRNRAWTPAGLRVALGNRDALPEASPLAGRADRAAKNTLENLVLVTALLLAARAGGGDPERLVLGARLFFWARVAYVPLYLAGVQGLRTVAWAVGVAGMGAILSTAL
jgi:uncharacterized MAPEG superfamily protein